MCDELSDFVMRAVTEYLRNTFLYINGTKFRQQSLPELCSVNLRNSSESVGRSKLSVQKMIVPIARYDKPHSSSRSLSFRPRMGREH